MRSKHFSCLQLKLRQKREIKKIQTANRRLAVKSYVHIHTNTLVLGRLLARIK